jgi:integrase
MLGLGRTKIYEMMASGELPVVRIGTAVRLPRQRLLDWIGEPKSEQSRRTVRLPAVTVTTLRHRTWQKRERLKAGGDWHQSTHVFTSTIGSPLDERNVRRAFKDLLTAAKLPKIRIHDLRHTCATLLLAQGVHPKVVQETLGHSQISLTMDTYSHVLPHVSEEAAAQMDAVLRA